MPAGFRFIEQDTDVWAAIGLNRAQAWRETAGRFLYAVGRLDAGATLGTARREMEAIAERLAATHAFNKDTLVELVPLRDDTVELNSALGRITSARQRDLHRSAMSGKDRSETRPQPTVFYSHRQMPETVMTLHARTSKPPAIVSSAVAAVHRIDPNLAVTRIQTFEGALAESLARERLSALVSAGFAVSGLLLASLGLYGLLAFLVAERTKEIGIRIALGEQLARLTRSVVGSGLRLVVIGAAIGIGGSILLLRSLRTMLFGVTPNDASTYVAVVTLLCAVSALASYVPARWAARVQPLTALRHE